MDATDSGRDLGPAPLDAGLCCHDSVPLLEREVACDDGLGIDGLSATGGGGRGREKSSPDMAFRSGLGDIDPERPSVRD